MRRKSGSRMSAIATQLEMWTNGPSLPIESPPPKASTIDTDLASIVRIDR